MGWRSYRLTRTLSFAGLPGLWDAQRQVWGQVSVSLTPLGQYCAGHSDARGLSKRWARLKVNLPVCVPVITHT